MFNGLWHLFVSHVVSATNVRGMLLGLFPATGTGGVKKSMALTAHKCSENPSWSKCRMVQSSGGEVDGYAIPASVFVHDVCFAVSTHLLPLFEIRLIMTLPHCVRSPV